MFVRPIMIGTMLVASAPSAQAQAPASASGTKPVGTCEALAADWKRFEQNMADRFAEGVADNSAPRATMREMREANDLALAQMTLQFMRDNRCPLPKRAPSAGTYLTSALECSTARLKARGTETPPECDRSRWIAK